MVIVDCYGNIAVPFKLLSVSLINYQNLNFIMSLRYCFSIGILTVLLFACKGEAVKSAEVKEELNIPVDVKKVLNAHGGIETWKAMRSMSYEMPKDDKVEKQFIDLWDRREMIETEEYKMGYDGKDFWTDADTTVKTNPIFYKNLIFYFYAMPFVLADQGIKYEKVPNLVFDDVEYPGFRISYDDGVGVSPEDEYFLHYNSKTYQMEWLGYTVTYYSKEKSTKVKWIRYDDWQELNGLRLPASMMWYTNEDNKPLEERSRRKFNHVKVGEEAFSDDVFKATAAARIVTE